MASRLDAIQRANASYIEELYARYREAPDSVPEDWGIFFAGFELAGPSRPGGAYPANLRARFSAWCSTTASSGTSQPGWIR